MKNQPAGNKECAFGTFARRARLRKQQFPCTRSCALHSVPVGAKRASLARSTRRRLFVSQDKFSCDRIKFRGLIRSCAVFTLLRNSGLLWPILNGHPLDVRPPLKPTDISVSRTWYFYIPDYYSRIIAVRKDFLLSDAAQANRMCFFHILPLIICH